MFLQEPSESPYDLRFDLLGFPIRISWTFWIASVVFGFGLVDMIDRAFGEAGPGRFALLLLWALCLLASILIHELGHALAFRQFGIHSSIVLYHFGGLAIPSGSFVPGRGFRGLTEPQSLWIALAGPLAQLGSAAILVAIVKWQGFEVLAFALMPAGLSRMPGMLEGAPLQDAGVGLFAMVTFYVWPSVVWALLNLVPVWPLDGGRITRSLILIGGGTTETSLWISVIAAGLLAAYGFTGGQFFMGILFLSLAVTNYQSLQGGMGPRF